jgi:hypothetical protein
VTERLHCADCDSIDCAGFVQPAPREPIPPTRPAHVASEATRTAALATIRAELAAARKRSQEKP